MRTFAEFGTGCGPRSIGLEQAGFEPRATIDADADLVSTLRANRPGWPAVIGETRAIDGRVPDLQGLSLLVGSYPVPPTAGGAGQDQIPEFIRLVREAQPEAFLLDCAPDLGGTRWASYRTGLMRPLRGDGPWQMDGRIVRGGYHGTVRAAPRWMLVGFRDPRRLAAFAWPHPEGDPRTVGELVGDLMAAGGWPGAAAWAARADKVAPSAGAGRGKAWKALGVNPLGLAKAVPGPEDPADLVPKLSLGMRVRLAGLPEDWQFGAEKARERMRQLGLPFPLPMARAFGGAIRAALEGHADARRVAAGTQMRMLG